MTPLRICAAISAILLVCGWFLATAPTTPPTTASSVGGQE